MEQGNIETRLYVETKLSKIWHASSKRKNNTGWQQKGTDSSCEKSNGDTKLVLSEHTKKPIFFPFQFEYSRNMSTFFRATKRGKL